MTDMVDLLVIGAGILGLATARAAREAEPGWSVTVLDKERSVAAHQSGRNSGVIHAGVYYRPGSAKAQLCRAGREELQAFCAARAIPVEPCGKLLVASTSADLGRLTDLQARCRANGVDAVLLDRAGIAAVEPAVEGLAALHVASTAIVSYPAVCAALADELQARGVTVELGVAVTDVHETPDGVEVMTSAGARRARRVVTCAGVHGDELARRLGAAVRLDGGGALPRILPFRGEYYELVAARRDLVRGLVYPIPDPDLPFLGVHLTRDIGGGVHVGPNAVLALGREAYDRRTVQWPDLAAMALTRSTWQVARRHWRTGIDEAVRSARKAAFVHAAQRLVPSLQAEDLVPAPAGIRAQAVAADGTLLDDFAFGSTPRTLHVLNAPSPGATASLAIGRAIVGRLTAPRATG